MSNPFLQWGQKHCTDGIVVQNTTVDVLYEMKASSKFWSQNPFDEYLPTFSIKYLRVFPSAYFYEYLLHEIFPVYLKRVYFELDVVPLYE